MIAIVGVSDGHCLGNKFCYIYKIIYKYVYTKFLEVADSFWLKVITTVESNCTCNILPNFLLNL